MTAAATNRQIGYCTNVHAGVDLASIRENLIQYAVPALGNLSRTRDVDSIGVGLWIPDAASRELAGGQAAAFREFLGANRLVPYTINGFPYANFHGPSVKQRVYLPTWAETERLEYTQRLAKVLAELLPEQQTLGSISTLPIGWPNNPFAADPGGDPGVDLAIAGEQLRFLATFLDQLYHETGKKIVVAIEPEPGCMIDTVGDMIDFFDRYLPGASERRYLTVCHDICHSAVMNESQRDVIAAYAEAGIGVGKVQVSSAIVAPWSSLDDHQIGAALEQLAAFAEDRYLHQTGQVTRENDFRLATDLPELIKSTDVKDLESIARWVIHFHVPIFLDRFGLLSTSRDDVIECLNALADDAVEVDFTGHFEVETYAWTVLPEDMRRRGLAEDIASELDWLMQQLGR